MAKGFEVDTPDGIEDIDNVFETRGANDPHVGELGIRIAASNEDLGDIYLPSKLGSNINFDTDVKIGSSTIDLRDLFCAKGGRKIVIHVSANQRGVVRCDGANFCTNDMQIDCQADYSEESTLQYYVDFHYYDSSTGEPIDPSNIPTGGDIWLVHDGTTYQGISGGAYQQAQFNDSPTMSFNIFTQLPTPSIVSCSQVLVEVIVKAEYLTINPGFEDPVEDTSNAIYETQHCDSRASDPPPDDAVFMVNQEDLETSCQVFNATGQTTCVASIIPEPEISGFESYTVTYSKVSGVGTIDSSTGECSLTDSGQSPCKEQTGTFEVTVSDAENTESDTFTVTFHHCLGVLPPLD